MNDMLRKMIMPVLAGCALAASATQITVGSYNIRVKTPDDQGVHNWNARRDYVALTVTDNGFDVVGFNEVKSASQRDDLTALLPQYTFSGWDGHEGFDTSETAVDLVAFRTDKFELLDEGWYFLCRDNGNGLQVWESSWDNSSYSNARHTSWVKLRVKGSGEIFYFFCTHLDHQGQIARMLQAHLNYEKVWEIAGHYPTVFVGDQNSTISRVNYLNLYNAGFTDAFSVVDDPVAKFGKDDPATSGQWKDDPSTSRRIDYIWVRGMQVDSYDHCTDTYDLGAMPSDHIAITARLTFVDPDLNNRYHYVSAGASGTGSKESPFGTLQEAVNAAYHGDTIYVAAGDYNLTAQVDIRKSVRIFGGYDETFENVTGRSSLKAGENMRCVMLRANTDVEMRNMGFYNGNVPASNQDGAGICAHGSRLILRDCELADNSAGRDGGGIDCTMHLILDRVTFLRNKAVRNGGGVCYDNPSKRYWYNFPIENCCFDGNEALDGSAVYLPRFVYGYVTNNTFVNNTASNGSTAYLKAIGTGNNLGANLTVLNNTFVLNKAAGDKHASAVYVEIEPEAHFAFTNNTVVGNESADGVAAVYMEQGVPYICNNIVAGNRGGDVFLNVTSGVTAAYNLYTSESAVSYRVNNKDIYADDFAGCVEGLARVLDGSVEGDMFVPALSLPEADAGAEGSAAQWTGVPTVKVVNPVWDATRALNTVTALRLREDVNRADVNNDCMKERTVSLTFDQNGMERPLDGTSTMGAREYVAPAGVDEVLRTEPDGLNTPDEYFDLQGRRVLNPGRGIYLRRRGTVVDKVVL